MALSADQRQVVRETWAQVVPIADTAAEMFYDRLFELDPSLRKLFKSADMPEQRRKLMQTLGVAVNAIDRPDQLVPTLEDLGRRHVGYGVEDRDYDTVGEALLWTLGRGLGDAFTPAARDAWAQTYSLVAGVMRRSAELEASEVALAVEPGIQAARDVHGSRVDALSGKRARVWVIPAAVLVCLLVGLLLRSRLAARRS